MKHFTILGFLFILIFIVSSLFAGNTGKAVKSDEKKGSLIIETIDDTGTKDLEKDKQKKIDTKESGKKKVDKDKHNEMGGKVVTGQDNEAKLKKDTVVGSVISINNLTGEVVVQDENNKTERTILVNRDTLKTLNAGDKVNVELTPGSNNADKLNIIAEGKGGSKSKSKKK